MTFELTGEIPFMKALGVQPMDMESGFRLLVPCVDHLLDEPGAGGIHRGVLIAVLDNVCGVASSRALIAREEAFVVTLDLRVDFIRPTTPGRAVIAEAGYPRVTEGTLLVHATAYHDDPTDPVAVAVGAFIRDLRRHDGSSVSDRGSYQGQGQDGSQAA